MDSEIVHAQCCFAVVAIFLVLVSVLLQVRAQAISVHPQKMPCIGTVDERFASYNIEMAEVTGGKFWNPYHSENLVARAPQPAQSDSARDGMDPDGGIGIETREGDIALFRKGMLESKIPLKKRNLDLGSGSYRVETSWNREVGRGRK